MASPVSETEDERHAIEDIVGPRFELKARLGAGATSQVYEALDRSCNRRVALKVMRPIVLAMPEVRTRLAHEVRAVASLDHPNIIRLYDANMHDGVLVLELVTGGSLQERIARGPVEPGEAVSIAKQIAVALAAAHDAGVIDRDLKPANVLMGEGGVVKVGDFGVAHVSDSALTETGARIGTPAYMSPEQLRSSRQVDARSDIYAAGLVLYELLVGKRFHADDAPSDPMRAVKDACKDPELVAIVARCLEEQREKRFESAHELVHALERIGKAKRRSMMPLLAFASAGGVAIAIGLAWRSDKTPAAVHGTPSMTASVAAELALPTPLRPKASPELKRAIARLYGLDMTGADAALDALVTANPADGDASYYRAWARAFGAGRSDRALEAIHAALRNDPSPNRRAVLESMEAYENHDFDQMLARVRPIAAASPGDWELAHALGEALSHSGAVDEGFATFDRIQTLAPRFLLPWSHVIEMALARGNRDAAERWTRALRETEDAHTIGVAWTMHWRISQGDAAGALQLAEESTNALPPRAHLWNSDPISEARTGALALLGRFDDARKVSVDASGNLRSDPDAQTLAWIAFAQGRDAEWRRWMAAARDEAKSGRLEHADLVHAEQSMAYSMAGDEKEADASLVLARAAVHGEPARSVGLAAVLRAWRKRQTSELPEPIPGTPELAQTSKAVREAIAGDDAVAIADLERALAIAAWAYSQAPIAWLGATLARGRDDAARERFCSFIRRPRHLFWHWAYARGACTP